MKNFRVDAPGHDADFFGLDAPFGELVKGVLTGNIDLVHLVVIPDHEFPGQAFDKIIPGQILGILGKLGMIG